MADDDVQAMKIGAMVDAAGIVGRFAPGDLPDGIVVLMTVQTSGGRMVKTMSSAGLDWLTRRGLLEVALQAEKDEGLRSTWAENVDDDE